MFIRINGTYKNVPAIYKKIESGWVEYSDFESNISNYKYFLYQGELTLQTHSITILSSPNITGESSQLHLLYNKTSVSTGINWSITSGSEYASISSDGLLTITDTADNSEITIHAEYNGLIADKNITVTYKSGTSQETNTTVNGDGTTTETTITTNEDGSSSASSVTTDEDGNITGESIKTTNSDGSSTEVQTTYNGDGTQTQSSTNTDTSGNSSTQTKDIDEDGNEVVTSYTIDTTNNENGGMDVNDNINTGFIPFANGKDWELDFRFIYDYKENIYTTVPLSASYFLNGILQSGFSMRMTQPGSNYNYYRPNVYSVNNSNKVTQYLYLDTPNGYVTTQKSDFSVHMTKAGSLMTFTITCNGSLSYRKTNQASSAVRTTNESFTITWNDSTTSTMDIMIGGQMNSSGQVISKCTMEVLEFNIHQL